MNDSLLGESIQLDTAGENLNTLIQLQESLTAQTDRVTAAIENLEVLDDLQSEVSGHVRSLTALRQSFVELAMMETTVGRIANIMSPLTELSSLRRLNPNEVRAAARMILDGRSTRLSQSASSIKEAIEAEVDTGNIDEADLVPLPPEARNLQ